MNAGGAILVIAGALAIAALIMAYPHLRRRWRAPADLDARERDALVAALPWRDLLDTDQRERLLEHSARLLAEVSFIGCNGLTVTRGMERVIAGQASLLCLGAEPGDFVLPREILVYPDAFYIPQDDPDEHGLVDDLPMLASGEAWPGGRVILSWRDIEEALAGADHNVVLHEFAHLLDFAAPEAEGAPDARLAGWSGASATPSSGCAPRLAGDRRLRRREPHRVLRRSRRGLLPARRRTAPRIPGSTP